MKKLIEVAASAAESMDHAGIVDGIVEAAEGIRSSVETEAGKLSAVNPDIPSATAESVQGEKGIMPQVLEGKDAPREGGLSACNYKCIMSYCYPVDIAKNIGTKKPHAPNSHIGHS